MTANIINYLNKKISEVNAKNQYYKEIYYLNLFNALNSYEKIHILSKGGNYDNLEEEDDTIYIGIKQSISQLPRPDILVMNDYEGLFGIEDVICKIKFIICPYLIHYKHFPSEVGHNKFLNYLKLHNFTGNLTYFIIGNRKNPDKRYHIYQEPIRDSAEVIFEFLTLANVNDKKIKINGLYETIEDNLIISGKILSSRVSFEHLDDFNSYIDRVISNKKAQNLLNMNSENENIENTLKKKREYIFMRYSKLFNSNYTLWTAIKSNNEQVLHQQ